MNLSKLIYFVLAAFLFYGLTLVADKFLGSSIKAQVYNSNVESTQVEPSTSVSREVQIEGLDDLIESDENVSLKNQNNLNHDPYAKLRENGLIETSPADREERMERYLSNVIVPDAPESKSPSNPDAHDPYQGY